MIVCFSPTLNRLLLRNNNQRSFLVAYYFDLGFNLSCALWNSNEASSLCVTKQSVDHKQEQKEQQSTKHNKEHGQVVDVSQLNQTGIRLKNLNSLQLVTHYYIFDDITTPKCCSRRTTCFFITCLQCCFCIVFSCFAWPTSRSQSLGWSDQIRHRSLRSDPIRDLLEQLELWFVLRLSKDHVKVVAVWQSFKRQFRRRKRRRRRRSFNNNRWSAFSHASLGPPLVVVFRFDAYSSSSSSFSQIPPSLYLHFQTHRVSILTEFRQIFAEPSLVASWKRTTASKRQASFMSLVVVQLCNCKPGEEIIIISNVFDWIELIHHILWLKRRIIDENGCFGKGTWALNGPLLLFLDTPIIIIEATTMTATTKTQ